MWSKKSKERKVPGERDFVHQRQEFYQTALDQSLGFIVGGEFHGSKFPGLMGETIHTEPKEGDYKGGKDGTVLVLSGDFEEFRGALKSAYDTAKSTATDFMSVIKNSQSTDDQVTAAKEKMEKAQENVSDQLKTFGTSTNHGQVARVRVRVDNDAHGHHGTRTENWIKFTLKYQAADGSIKSTDIATFDRAVNIGSDLRGAADAASRQQRDYKLFFDEAKQYLPQTKEVK